MADTHDKPASDDKPTPAAPHGEQQAPSQPAAPWGVAAASPPSPADTLHDLLASLPAEPPLPASGPAEAAAGEAKTDESRTDESRTGESAAKADVSPEPARTAPDQAAPAKSADKAAAIAAAKAAAEKAAVARAAAGKIGAGKTGAGKTGAAKSAKAGAARATPPSRRARHPLVVVGSTLMTLVLVAGIALMAAISHGETLLRKPGPLAAEKVVNLSRTPGFRDIGDVLEREGVVENAWVFVGGVMLRQARQELKAGEYLFPRGASVDDVIGIIASGKSVLHQVTIPEGLTSDQAVARLLENDILTGPIREIPKEGTLLPETYRFPRGFTREQILQRMAADQRRVVADIWARRALDLPLRTPEELVVLASIVEKETGKASERARVAAVFVNRLQRRMRLQSDPTIIYGLVGGKGSLGRPIYKSDIERPTAYNTYVIDGLPPGPIANPGRAALEATANPLQTKELYFVADGTGGHVFAETLEEHNRNVARWREIERQQGGQAAPAPAQPPAAAAPQTPAPAPAPVRPSQPRPQAPLRNGQ